MAETDWLAELTAGWTVTWREYLAQPAAKELAVAMRRHENTGRPLGDAGFVKKLEKLLHRRLTKQKPGPKPKRRPAPAKRKAN